MRAPRPAAPPAPRTTRYGPWRRRRARRRPGGRSRCRNARASSPFPPTARPACARTPPRRRPRRRRSRTARDVRAGGREPCRRRGTPARAGPRGRARTARGRSARVRGTRRLQAGDGFDLDERARRKPRHLDGRSCRRPLADVLRVDLVHSLEIVQVLQEDRRFHEPFEPAACGLEDRAEVREHLLGLLLDRPGAQLGVPGLERKLPRDEDEAAGLDPLRVRRALKRRRRRLGPHDLLLAAHDSRLLGPDACASATPSALKMASSTCCVSLPSTSLTCIVTRAPAANSSRKRAARSVASPAIRASERSTFEYTTGRSETSSTTCASASSAEMNAEPWPRAASARSGAASASPSARPAAASSASALVGSTSSDTSNDA